MDHLSQLFLTFCPEFWFDESVDTRQEDGQVPEDGEQPDHHGANLFGEAQAAAVRPLRATRAALTTHGDTRCLNCKIAKLRAFQLKSTYSPQFPLKCLVCTLKSFLQEMEEQNRKKKNRY